MPTNLLSLNSKTSISSDSTGPAMVEALCRRRKQASSSTWQIAKVGSINRCSAVVLFRKISGPSERRLTAMNHSYYRPSRPGRHHRGGPFPWCTHQPLPCGEASRPRIRYASNNISIALYCSIRENGLSRSRASC